MSITIYLLGVCISAAVWFGTIKARQRGFGIRMPDSFDGWFLAPMNNKNVDYTMVMLGWFLMSTLWPAGWALLILAYICAWFIEVISLTWGLTLGNEGLAHKIFGVKKK